MDHVRLMRLFDELVALAADARARRLETLGAEDAELAGALARMLAADARGGHVASALEPTAVMGKAAVAAPSDSARVVPERVGHYQLGKKLGAGGMGEVYAAVDERLGRKVAIKLLPEGTEWQTEARLRMLREAQAASALNHPGIVTLFDIEAYEGRLLLVMELVDGESFFVLAEGGLPPAEALTLTAEAADALAAAHAAGVLHRDIKSENLMRKRGGGVKVLDFGVAKIVGEAARARSSKVWELAASPVGEPGASERRPPVPLETAAGLLIGTPAYLAPELLGGASPSPRSEVFALGVVLYELLSGTRPFARNDLQTTLAAVRACKPEPPSRRAAARQPPISLDAAIDALVLKALARRPEDRFAGMGAFAAAIRELLTPPVRRRPRWIAPAAAGAAIAAAAGIYVGGRDDEPRPALSGTARRLTFEPGCEEFPSFTPDGKTLVFDGLVEGDYEVQAQDLASGARRRLTHARGWDYAAAVSPDGKQVAYVHQGDASTVRVMSLDGDQAPTRLGHSDGYPMWSRRGTLYFGEGDKIREWDPVAGTRDIATLPPERRAIYFAPFPDGAVGVVLGTAEQEIDPTLALLRGARLEPIAARDLAEYAIAASPSGTELYFQRYGAAGIELVRQPRTGGKVVALEGGVSATGSLAFAPDGRQLAYSTCHSTSYLARITGGRVEPLTRAAGWSDNSPVQLDAGHVLFTSDCTGQSQLWRLDLASGEAEVVAPLGYRPSLAPDRRHLAWTIYEPPGIVVAELDASGLPGPPRRVTDRRGDSGPQFTHDGATLLFVRLDEAGGDRVYVVPAAGGAVRPLAAPGVMVASASPVADEVVYLINRDTAGVDVVRATLDGDAPSVIMTLPAGSYRSLRHAPDGRRLLMVHEEQEILELDRAATPPEVRTLWRGGVESITAAEYAPDGASVLAGIVTWEGDLWIVEGRF